MDPAAAGVPLTARERQVQKLAQAGFSSKVIAQRLGITARTVAFHRANIRAKYRAAFDTDEVKL